MRRKLLVIVGLVCVLFFAAASLYTVRDRLDQGLAVSRLLNDDNGGGAKSSEPEAAPKPQDDHFSPADNITAYVDQIFGKKETKLPNLVCPPLDKSRYSSLKVADRRRQTPRSGRVDTIQYFFALNLRENVSLLPRLLGSVVEVVRFLGPHRCALSIVEGNSDDGTDEVLAALRPDFNALGLHYSLHPSTVNPKQSDRIPRLADLRNLALRPLVEQERGISGDPNSTVVIFLNDVAACPDDILELVLQRAALGAEMTCAMDWTFAGEDPTFYDVWISRGMNGDSFFQIPPDGTWGLARDIFWNAPESLARLQAKKPFQVYACWNGAAAFSAGALLEGDEETRLRFRAPNAKTGECFQGEPQLFCKDLWYRGRGKIAVVPSVNLEYTLEGGEKIKKNKGFTNDNVRGTTPGQGEDGIEWQLEPPKEVRCMETWGNQFWRAWDEALPPRT